jgi:outer membrane lipoprotein LolB
VKRLLPLIAATAALIGGCAHAPVGGDGMSYAERRTRLATVQDWGMRGRLAVNNGERAFQGSFEWQQQSDTLRLQVRGPLGAGLLEVTGPLDHLTVTARGESREISDPEKELSSMLGWWLPVASLRDWLIGLPDARYPVREEFGSDGNLVAFEQRQWQVAYRGYQVAAGMLVPRRIELTHAKLELRLVIDSWLPTALN